MSEQQPDPVHPEQDDAAPKKPFEQPGNVRRMLWLVGGGIGLYMIAQGVYGILTGGS